MSAHENGPAIEQDYDFAEPPEKVWRAISTPALRARWLPDGRIDGEEPVALTPGEAVSYRMRDPAPPFLESIVTFSLAPNGAGGTRLSIRHELTDARIRPLAPAPANANGPLMRAA